MANNYHIKHEFLLQRKEIELVKPAKPTPIEILSLSTLDNDPNLEILCQSIYVYKAKHDEYCNGNSNGLSCSKADPASVIKDALAKVLVHYYPLAGKLKQNSDDGKLYVHCDGQGVPFLQATSDSKLSSLGYLDGVDVKISKELIFDYPPQAEDSSGYHPLVIQVTEFSCGGFTIGMGLSHSICDGFGASQLFRALAELASGMSELKVKPVWERERLVVKPSQEPFQFPQDMGSLSTSPYLPTTDVLRECFYISSEAISRLKADMLKELRASGEEELKDSSFFTTVEVLAAYIWRSRFGALKLTKDGKNLLFLTTGIRNMLNPPLPIGYYGNAFVPSILDLPGSALDEGPLSKIANLIKESKKRTSNSDYIWQQISIIEKFREMNMKVESCGATLVFTDWRQLGLLEGADFGLEASLVNMIPLPWDIFGHVDLCFLLPPCKLEHYNKGGVRLLVTLPTAAMPTFKEEIEALSKLRDDPVYP